MTKRKIIIISDSDSDNESQRIRAKKKLSKSSRAHKSDPVVPVVEIIESDEDSSEVVPSAGTIKRKNCNNSLQNNNTKNMGRVTRSRAHNRDNDVTIVEGDTLISKSNKVTTIIDMVENNDKEGADDPNQKQVNDTYLSIKDGAYQVSKPSQVTPSLETTENVDKDSEMNEKTAQCIEKGIEQTEAGLSIEPIEEADADSEINEQTTRNIEKIIEQMDADSSLEATREVDNNGANNKQTAPHIENTTEQTDENPSLETIDHNDGNPEINERTVQPVGNMTEPTDTGPSLETIEHNDGNPEINEETVQPIIGNMPEPTNSSQDLETTEEVDKDPEPNEQTMRQIENTAKQIDACVGTEELDELLRKKQIYPWTQLYQIKEKKNYFDSDEESEDEDGKKNRCIQTVPVAKQWQHVISAMEDPSGVVRYTDDLLIIKERQPKGRFHYLILPIENMRNLNELKKEHMQLLKNMEEAAKEIISNPEHSEETFRFGFIAKPTMVVLRNQKFLWLHMHVISNTPNFAYITKKQIWNTFHSKMFMTIQEVQQMLATTGTVTLPTPEDCNFFLTDDATCHQCDFRSPTFPKLVRHIKEHSQKAKEKIKKKKKNR